MSMKGDDITRMNIFHETILSSAIRNHNQRKKPNSSNTELRTAKKPRPEYAEGERLDNMKEKIIGLFGAAGNIIFLIGSLFVNFLIQFAPLVALRFPFWIDLLLIIAITYIPIANIVVNVVIWIWGLVVTIQGRQDWFAIVYYIVFLINLIHVIAKASAALSKD